MSEIKHSQNCFNNLELGRYVKQCQILLLDRGQSHCAAIYDEIEVVLTYSTHMSVEAVGHEFKLSIGRDEGDCAVVLKARQTDTLVKLDIFQLYWFTLPPYIKKKEEIILQGDKQKSVPALHEMYESPHGQISFANIFKGFSDQLEVSDKCGV